jgi:hypothetical protein
MIYRGPGFLTVVLVDYLLRHPLSSPLSRHQVVSLSQPFCVSLVELIIVGSGGEEGFEEEPNQTIARKPGPL